MPKGGCRHRKPTALKVIQGTARRDRMPANEPKPAPVRPDMPKGLPAAGRRLWQALAPKLERIGLLTETDGPLFAALCEAWSRYCDARRRYRQAVKAAKGMATEEGLALIRKAEVSVEKAEQAVRLLAVEFGLSPAARSRIDLPAEGDEEDGALEQLWTAR